MQCPFCKSELNPGASVCGHCGATEEADSQNGCLGIGLILLGLAFAAITVLTWGKWQATPPLKGFVVVLGVAMVFFGLKLGKRSPTSAKHWVRYRGGNRYR
jgi:uncharacterized membrane protein